MIFEIINKLKGIFSIFLYKLIYQSKISFLSTPLFGANLSVVIRKEGQITFGKKVSGRKRIDFLAENGEVKIGNNVFFNNDCSINCQNSIAIGDNCLFGENVKLYDHNHKYDHNEVKHSEFTTGAIKIGNNCWLGTNSVVLKGVEIGEGSIIGAGVIVHKNIPPQSIIVMDNLKLIEKKK